MKHSKQQQGISLVEVLVAMVISLFLLAGIIQVYLANTASYSFTNAISRIQENARYAMDTMAQDLRMAGYFGCAVFDRNDEAAMDAIVNNLDPAGPGYDPDLFDILGEPLIEGTENDVNGSDTITLRGALPGNATPNVPYAVSTSAQILITLPNDIEQDDIVMISNCRGADIFQVTSTTVSGAANSTAVVHNIGTGSPGNYNPDTCTSGHCLSQTYGADATMYKLQTVTYSIAPGASGEPALWRSANGVNEELVEGIEQMQVQYGVDTSDNGATNRYLTADLITDDFTVANNWDNVMSIRLMLLARSAADGVVEGNQMVDFNGTNTSAGDQRLRQVFTTTIALRNRVSDT